ncbi:MAG: hypothetical protein QNJ47_01160 [Nostocaceae cyanobacterium]|nr:hypothetical protein [Nostocaceae cyanobacterium]
MKINFQKINKLLAVSLTAITLTSGNFIIPEMSVAVERGNVTEKESKGRIQKLGQGVQYIVWGFACFKGLQTGWVERKVQIPKNFNFSPATIVNIVCQAPAAGARYVYNECQARGICPKEYKVAVCPACREVTIYVYPLY